MKLKLSLKNTGNPALLLSIIFSIIISLSGCSTEIKPTYKEEDIPRIVQEICKKEYSLDVITERAPSTLWIYAPLSKILHKEYGTKPDKFFDDEIMDKLRNILNTIGRVVISSDVTPEFFALLASDITIGLDYTIIGNVLDIKKSYAGVIPWTEANRRYVMKFTITPEAIGDSSGIHLLAYEIKLRDFLAQQIAQRIAARFRDEGLDKYFKGEKSEGRFEDETFIFEYSISRIAQTDKNINILKEILDIIAYCLKSYEFTDFSKVEITDLIAQSKLILTKGEILARPTD
jgi:hypothetical protein